MGSRSSFLILMVDDDDDDRRLMDDALVASERAVDLRVVTDGVEALEYLRNEGHFSDPSVAPRPNLILLDLNMPRKDGLTTLAEIKADPALRSIPVVVFTTSALPEDIASAYDLGASSYCQKPASFDRLVELMAAICSYWGEFVRFPDPSLCGQVLDPADWPKGSPVDAHAGSWSSGPDAVSRSSGPDAASWCSRPDTGPSSIGAEPGFRSCDSSADAGPRPR